MQERGQPDIGDPRGFPLSPGPGAAHLNRARFVVVLSGMARRSAAPGSRRRHGDVRRRHRLTAWFSAAEIDAVRLEAARHGKAPAAWLAKLGTDAAGAAVDGEAGGRALAVDAADAAADMSEATEVARKIGYLFNQAVAALHSTGEHSPGLEASGAAVASAVRRMESATLRTARELLR